VGPSPQQDRIERGEPPGLYPLWHVPYPPGDLHQVEVVDLFAIKRDTSSLRTEDAVQAFQERRLPHTVRPQDSDDLALAKRERHLSEHLTVPVHEPEFIDREYHRRYPRRSR
jgi:hypothetical protein